MDIVRNDDEFLQDIKSIKDTTVSFGIMKLLDASYILDFGKDYIKKGIEYEDYIKMNRLEKAKFLFNSYINSSSVYINETKRIQRGKFKMNLFPDLKDARTFIIDMLKLLPHDYSWIDAEQFRESIRMKDYNFLRKYTGTVLEKDKYEWYSDYYDDADFEDFEYGFIDICLMEYLAVLGIVDVIVDWVSDEYGTNEFLEVEYIRLTELGCILLGIKELEIKEIKNSTFVLNDNFEIIVYDGKNRLEYELYFERFTKELEKTLDNSIYKLDFISLAKANDIGIKITEIVDYIKENAKSYSESALNYLKDIAKLSSQITIKQVCIVEFSDKVRDKLFTDKEMQKLLSNNRNISVISKKEVKDIKKKIEKLELFCDIEDECDF